MTEVEVDKPPSRGHLGSDPREGDPKSRGATNARADARGNEVWWLSNLPLTGSERPHDRHEARFTSTSKRSWIDLKMLPHESACWSRSPERIANSEAARIGSGHSSSYTI